jgi:hypothetical protein
MAIWILYTECDSEPTFWGYVRSKSKALKWCIDELENRGCSLHDLADHGNGFSSQAEDDAHYVHAVALKPL